MPGLTRANFRKLLYTRYHRPHPCPQGHTEDAQMERLFTLEYWMDDEWYVGKLKEVPGVFSQGATLDELETNIRDAYHLMNLCDLIRKQPGVAQEK